MSQAGYTPIQLYYSATAAATPSAGNLAAGELAVNITDGKLFYKDNGGVVRVLATAAGSAGDVVGPGSSTDNALVRFDGTTGKLVQNSAGVLSDAGALSGLTSVAATTFTGALTGNASTATTLQTSRTIWGQSFDGSANVTGALTGVTDLTASGSLTLNGGTANGVAYLNGSKVLTTGSALTFDGANFGVGSNAPGQKFVVNGASGVAMQLENSSDSNRGGRFVASGSAASGTFAVNTTSSGYALTFGIDSNEQMRLTSTGLGIGTSSPSQKLDVRGSMYMAATNARLYIDNGGVGGSSVQIGASGTSHGYIGTDGNFPLVFQPNNTERMRLDSSGNLGLGVTPSAWSTSGWKALEVGFAGNAFTSNAGNSSGITSNAVLTSTGWKYGLNGAANFLAVGNAGGSYAFFTAPSGTAGNAISFTQAMTLDASGNLLVGLTSSSGLSVGNGNIVSNGIVGAKGPLADHQTNMGVLQYASNITTIRSYGATAGTGIIAFNTGGGGNSADIERARIDSSGNLLVGTTSSDPISAQVNGLSIRGTVGDILASAGDTPALQIARRGSDGGVIQFYKNTTAVGSVSTTSVLTTYNTTSDYRLKNVIGAVVDAGTRIDALEPVEYEWKSEGSRTRGFLAHKFQEVYPSSVTGTKDAVDKEGKPAYQGMQAGSSEVIADLVAEIQSLRKRLAALESK